MTDLPNMTGSEVSVFVENTLTQIKDSIKKVGGDLTEPIQFDLAITEKKEVGVSGGWKQFIVIGGKKESENVQRVKFSVIV